MSEVKCSEMVSEKIHAFIGHDEKKKESSMVRSIGNIVEASIEP